MPRYRCTKIAEWTGKVIRVNGGIDYDGYPLLDSPLQARHIYIDGVTGRDFMLVLKGHCIGSPKKELWEIILDLGGRLPLWMRDVTVTRVVDSRWPSLR